MRMIPPEYRRPIACRADTHDGPAHMPGRLPCIACTGRPSAWWGRRSETLRAGVRARFREGEVSP